jgi:hypothetical protein
MNQVHLCQARIFSTVLEKQTLKSFEFHLANNNQPIPFFNVTLELDRMEDEEKAEDIKRPFPSLSPLRPSSSIKRRRLKTWQANTVSAVFALSPIFILWAVKPLLIGLVQ